MKRIKPMMPTQKQAMRRLKAGGVIDAWTLQCAQNEFMRLRHAQPKGELAGALVVAERLALVLTYAVMAADYQDRLAQHVKGSGRKRV